MNSSSIKQTCNLPWLSLFLATLIGSSSCLAQTAINPDPSTRQPPDLTIRGKMPDRLEEIDVKIASRTPQILRLERDDSIKMAVLGYPELTHVAKIQRDGRVTLPVVGDIPAEGKTLNDLRNEVRDLLTATKDTKIASVAIGDVLKMIVWRHPDLSATVPIAADGTVTLPMAGDIEAAGKTLAELRETVRQRLSSFLRDPQVSIVFEKQVRHGLVVDPQVSILPERTRDRKVVVMGEVMIQGPQTIAEQSRVMDVLGGARLNMVSAQLNDIVLIRNADGKVPQYTKLLIDDYLNGKAPDQNIYLAPDDVIFVPKTTISAVGDFIERFFVRTKPLFDWWNAMYQARYAEDYNRSIIQLYERTLNP